MEYVAVKLEQDLAPMDEGNSEKQVKSRSMNQYDHVMILKHPQFSAKGKSTE